MTARLVQRRLRALANPAQAKILRRFFRTGPGEYGEGDVFLGVMVPVSRKIAATFRRLPLAEIRKLLRSRVHEERLVALLLLVRRFSAAAEPERRRIFRLYLRSRRYINSWDLVDLTAPNIVGAYLADRDRAPLRRLARSPNLWLRRIAIVATHWFIRRNDFRDTLQIAAMLRNDREDLIRKAVGWMLREVGKRDPEAEESFLRAHAARMPRTMLRYAIERFPEPKRRRYLGMAVGRRGS
jgi:3-methyladenine DNA glycosylase AlkD